jgi:hypothetical protein
MVSLAVCYPCQDWLSRSKGTVTLLLGQEKGVENAWGLIESLKGEPPLEVPTSQAVYESGDMVVRRRPYGSIG